MHDGTFLLSRTGRCVVYEIMMVTLQKSSFCSLVDPFSSEGEAVEVIVYNHWLNTIIFMRILIIVLQVLFLVNCP